MWGSTGIFVRFLNDHGLYAMQITEIRAALTALCVIVGLLIFKRELLRVRFRDLWCFLGTGILSILMFNYCYLRNIQMTSLSVAAILLYTSPIFVMLMSVLLFREHLTGQKLICLAMAFGGCALVSGVLTGGGLTGLSILLGLGSGFGYALYSIFSRYALIRGYHPLTITAYTFLFASIGGLFLTDFAQIRQAVALSPVPVVSYLLLYALITTILPYIFYTTGLTVVENSKAAVMATIEPITASVIGITVFHEIPTISSVCGILLVLAALVLLQVQLKPPKLKGTKIKSIR